MAWLNSFFRPPFQIVIVSCLFAISGCEQETLLAVNETPLIARGRITYNAYCLACHNADPRRAGAVGPDVAFSNLELLTLRILKAEYPAGYRAKRPGTVMPAMPHLKEEIEGLNAYLNALKKP